MVRFSTVVNRLLSRVAFVNRPIRDGSDMNYIRISVALV